ncbi:hypothetical protein HY68_34815 [Streptomyces sp. AcH 505]|uniref:hypothetical protein n=1 Tax=Streptomyces sp. AcH 505 TaxID=352211 RepID=UPI00059222AE|nr:hypothetical protein HY68_34815 [Streptomyces sp. AcH 505]
MIDTTTLDNLLRTDPEDVGCGQAMAALHVYAELAAGGSEAMPGVEAHLRACGPCSEDYQGLLRSVTFAAGL